MTRSRRQLNQNLSVNHLACDDKAQGSPCLRKSPWQMLQVTGGGTLFLTKPYKAKSGLEMHEKSVQELWSNLSHPSFRMKLKVGWLKLKLLNSNLENVLRSSWHVWSWSHALAAAYLQLLVVNSQLPAIQPRLPENSRMNQQPRPQQEKI